MHSTFKMAGWLNQSRPTIGQKHLWKKGWKAFLLRHGPTQSLQRDGVVQPCHSPFPAQSMTGPGIGREAETVSGS